MIRTLRPLLPFAPFALLTVPVSAQTITPLVTEGDTVLGVGDVTTISAIAVNDLGEWLVEADTDNPDGDVDSVVLKDGALFAQEGESLAAPSGTSIGSFDSVQMNDAGDLGWNLFLDGAASGTDSGFFFNKTLLIQEGDAPTIPGVTAGSAFQGFFDAKIDAAGTSLVLATIDDPAIASSVDQIFLLVSGTDSSSLSIATVAKEGDVLPGQIEPVEDFSTSPHGYAYSDAGHVMFVADLAGSTSVDDAVYLDSTLLAQEGSASPIAGRPWASLSSAKVDCNDSGEHVYTGTLEGDSATASLIVKNGAKFRQEGDSIAPIAPFVLTSFGSGPVWISNDGDVLWYGDWDDPDTTQDSGLFLNDELLLQEGATQLAGLTVTAVRGVQDGYMLSDEGSFAICELELEGNLQVAALIDLQLASVTGMSDCTDLAASLTFTGGSPEVGGSFDLTLANPQGAGVFPALGISTQPATTYPPCGQVIPGVGEVLIGILPPNPVLTVTEPATGGGPTVFTIPLGPDPSLAGVEAYAQGLYLDLLGSTSEPIRPSTGLAIVVGA